MTDLHTDTERALLAPLRAGEVVGSRYRLDGLAGAGGMATVWRAYDERLQRPVAIKVISDALATNPAAVSRFAREARTHARIQHPNLVQVYDYSVTATQPYLVMEYVNGCTLSERLDRGGFSDAELHALATELLSAVACVHNQGVLHRDIKSGNVLLDKDGHARLTDFGLARLEDATQITRPNEVVGTLRFLAPELIEGKPASRQSDLYALGVLLRSASAETEPEAPLPKLITWLTQQDPDARPSDADAVLTALRNGQRRGALQRPDAQRKGGQRRDAHRPPGHKPRVHRPPVHRPPGHMPSAGRPRPIVQDEGSGGSQPQANRRQYTATREFRTRTAAISAIVVAVAGTALAVLDAGGASPARASSTGSTRSSTSPIVHASTASVGRPTIDQRLQKLASEVRRAAAKP